MVMPLMTSQRQAAPVLHASPTAQSYGLSLLTASSQPGPTTPGHSYDRTIPLQLTPSHPPTAWAAAPQPLELMDARQRDMASAHARFAQPMPSSRASLHAPSVESHEYSPALLQPQHSSRPQPQLKSPTHANSHSPASAAPLTAGLSVYRSSKALHFRRRRSSKSVLSGSDAASTTSALSDVERRLQDQLSQLKDRISSQTKATGQEAWRF